MTKSLLKAELEFFARNLAQWLEHHEGKFALIKREDLHDFYDSESSAYRAGIEVWGPDDPFLVKQVSREEHIEHIPALHLGLMNVDL